MQWQGEALCPMLLCRGLCPANPPSSEACALVRAVGCDPLPTLMHTWAPVSSLAAVHLEDRECHGCEHVLAFQDLGIPELQREQRGGLWGQQVWKELLDSVHT